MSRRWKHKGQAIQTFPAHDNEGNGNLFFNYFKKRTMSAMLLAPIRTLH